ncbi:MAG: PhoH family protein [Magnetovibrio sp.]|nr:PhoH family protein [Magnetovibrio sp.]
MGKKSRRRQSTAASADVHALYPRDGNWDPLQNDDNRYGNPAENRDQRYVKNVSPRSEGQKQLMDAIDHYNLVMALGPAGTGKTYLAIAKAVESFERGEVGRIVLTRPAVEAGESLGYLPGEMEDKIAPYLRPLFDSLTDRMGGRSLKTMMKNGEIEIAPVGFMRGRTLNNAFVVIDEAQNCTYTQIKMLLTRMGWHSTMVVTGDPDQSDLLPGMSGLADISQKLEALDDIGVVRLQDKDVVRHPLVAEMLSVV